MTFRAVLTVAFDWNGTLVDDAERACAAAGIVLERRGLPPLERDRFHEGFHLPLRTWIASLGVPAREVDEAIREWNQEIGNRPAELTAGARRLAPRPAARPPACAARWQRSGQRRR